VTSENCDLSLVLFDEIEKSAQSVTRLLLGILDKGVLHLGDNTVVNFEKSLIFFTSNLGAREMMKALNPHIGFQSAHALSKDDLETRLESIALGAVRRRFSPEFVNRIDAVITYNPLDAEAMETILDHDLRGLQEHVNLRLGDRGFSIEISRDGKDFLLRNGVSKEYGARELKRTIHRQLTQPLATMVARGEILPGAYVTVSADASGEGLSIKFRGGKELIAAQTQTILIADDNHELLILLAAELKEHGWDILIAENGAQARLAFYQRRPEIVLLDYILGEDDGLDLALEFQRQAPSAHIVLMTGGGFSDDLMGLCERQDFPVLYKPFLGQDILNLLRGRFVQANTVAA
jgi:CheY-like chemotaxis protein